MDVVNRILQEQDLTDVTDLKEEDYLPALIIGSLLCWQKPLILFMLYLKQGLKTNQVQHIFKSLAYLNSSEIERIHPELNRFNAEPTKKNDSVLNLNLSEREQKCQYLRELDNSESAVLYGLSFLIYKPEAHTAGLMLGSCEHIITDLKTQNPNGILRYYTYNEIIDLFMDRINEFAKISTRLKLFNPEIKYVYTLFLNTFKKQILLINK